MLITTAITAMLACEKSDQTQSAYLQVKEVNSNELNQDTSNNEEREIEKIENKDNSSTKDNSNKNDNDVDKQEKEAIKENVQNQENKEEQNQIPVEREINDISSLDLIKDIKIGWNLGNTLDATGGSSLSSETSWGNPYTTKEMIDEVKNAGFNALRIPITWEKHLGPAPEYEINSEWLNRVQEVVNFGIQNEMYVIINMHHEEWHFPSYENLDAAKTILTTVWNQIAERFKYYDEHLIFEGLNEPRMKGTDFEWNGGNKEGREVVNQLNAAFVETIRNAEGNNQLRHLMIPTYAASSDTKTWRNFTIPNDDKVIVSIHAYTPYNFALNNAGTATWSKDNPNDTKEIDYLMKQLDDYFISKGIPVIIGEFGARDKNNLDSRVAWSEYYIKKALEKGIPCIWWDNGAFTGNGELFGLLSRRNLTWKYPEIIDALMKNFE